MKVTSEIILLQALYYYMLISNVIQLHLVWYICQRSFKLLLWFSLQANCEFESMCFLYFCSRNKALHFAILAMNVAFPIETELSNEQSIDHFIIRNFSKCNSVVGKFQKAQWINFIYHHFSTCGFLFHVLFLRAWEDSLVG